jgi:hypothetical protein
VEMLMQSPLHYLSFAYFFYFIHYTNEIQSFRMVIKARFKCLQLGGQNDTCLFIVTNKLHDTWFSLGSWYLLIFSQEIFCFYGTHMLIIIFTKNPSFSPMFSHLNPFHIFIPCLSKIYVFLPSMSRSCKWALPLGFPTGILYWFLF